MGVENGEDQPSFRVRRFNKETQQFDTFEGTPTEEREIIPIDDFSQIISGVENTNSEQDQGDQLSTRTVIPHHHGDMGLLLEKVVE